MRFKGLSIQNVYSFIIEGITKNRLDHKFRNSLSNNVCFVNNRKGDKDIMRT